jgi:hypothetical protein
MKRSSILIFTATLLLGFAWFYGVSPAIQKTKAIICMDDIRELNVYFSDIGKKQALTQKL